jgi:hypothetical protein
VALKRINFLHGHYKISNDDYLYVLSVFVVEGMDWCERVGYRRPHPKEKIAWHLYWQSIGEQMGIQNIPPTYEETVKYWRDYEQKQMKFSKDNLPLGNAAIELFLIPIPRFLHPLARPVIYAMCTEEMRQAMGFPTPPLVLIRSLQGLLQIYSFVVGHFCLPRRVPLMRPNSSDDSDKADKKNVQLTSFDPYEKTYKDGYRIEELGPARLCSAMR